jgi:phage terminase large subunit GpA-like protein
MASLATLQAERERLRAAQSKADFDKLLAETCDLADLREDAIAARAVILQALDDIAGRWLRAIEGEHDETRVHYLMSDVAHDVLREIGDNVQAATTRLPWLGERIARGAKPRDLLTASQWADRHRVMRTGTNAPGPWRTALTPYLRDIMDDLSEHSPVRKVVFIKSSGVGGTEAMYNWLGYVMHHLQNKDLLVVVPTLELRDRSFNPRLAKMIDESEALSGLVTTASRNKANRGDLLEYGARARIIKAGANSPDSLRSDHLPYVICDEVDAFPWDVGGEGDPMTLIENRQRTFSRAKTYLVSTPTLEGQSRIDIEYRRTDMRRYHVPCPHCGEYQHLEFGGKAGAHGLKWRTAPPPEDDPHHLPQVLDAWYVCRHCGAEISEGHKPDMLAAGHWVAQRPGVKLARGYHLNALYAPTGLGLDWKAVAQKWINSQGDTAELKGFVNTYLGEVWREQGDSIEEISLISRLEDYTRDTLTADGHPLYAIITAGCDVQKDRIEVTVAAWGEGEQAWLLDHLILPGDTAQPDVWDELADTLTDAGVNFACVDSGYNTSMVYEFVKPRAWCRAVKGMPGTGRPLIEDEKIRRQRLRRQRKRGVQVEPLGVDQGKALLYARLKLQAPGPGYIHFPRLPAFDDEYFAQLAAEKLVTRFRGTRPVQEWVQTRPRNETLDCLNYALAACRLSGRRLDVPAQSPADGSRNGAANAPGGQSAQATAKSAAPRSKIAKSEWSSRL